MSKNFSQVSSSSPFWRFSLWIFGKLPITIRIQPPDVVVPTASEAGGSANQAAGTTVETQEGIGDEPVVVDDSSSSSDSESSSEAAPGDEVAEKCMSRSS